MIKYTDEHKDLFLDLLRKNNLNVSKAVESMRKGFPSFERKTFYNWRDADQAFSEKYEELIEREIDEAEDLHRLHRRGIPKKDEDGNMAGWVLKPDRQAIEFFLKTKGRHRGYVERTEHTGADDSPQELVIFVRDGKDHSSNT